MVMGNATISGGGGIASWIACGITRVLLFRKAWIFVCVGCVDEVLKGL